MNAFVPVPDALPIPAPVVVFEILMHLTFTVHLLLMNVMFGGLVLSAVAWFARKSPGDANDRMVGKLAKHLPTVFAFTVTAGVAPLLFMQVLYGNLFYTSSILMGWPWFLVIVALTIAYYGLYMNSFRGDRLGGARGPVVLVSALLVAAVGFLFTNNTSLMLTPAKWQAMYAAAPGGTSLNTSDPSLWPRFLHMALSAVAVAGLYVAHLGRRLTGDDELAALMSERGLNVFLGVTAVNVIAGFAYVMTLDRDVMLQFMGGSGHATGMLGMGVVLALVLLFTAFRLRSRPTASLTPLTVLTVVTVVVMVLMRDFVRKATLGGHYRPEEMVVEPQALNMIVFAALLVGGVITVVWMVRKLLAAGR